MHMSNGCLGVCRVVVENVGCASIGHDYPNKNVRVEQDVGDGRE